MPDKHQSSPAPVDLGSGPGGDEGEARPSLIHRAVAVLEHVAEAGGASARDIAETTGIPLPSVYRIAQELVQVGYLIHLREEKRFALGYKLHTLGARLHEDLGVPRELKQEIARLHTDTRMAAYLAIHRGADFVVVFVADSPACPRLEPMEFGFHETPHATAFGKLGLSEYSPEQRRSYLEPHQPHRLTPSTITDPAELESALAQIAADGIAWEHEEFQVGTTCAAVPIRADDGLLIGSVAVSAPVHWYAGQQRHVEHRLRATASRAGRIYRLGNRHA
ncbi:IclR family transcriptional regulator [Ornithinimicrobium murale]|uniref:IclR family transcriptional regulator n=1 Tax=Ornithinimicrobium murale TaxID=1050153 RepID=UPI000E0E02B2|nr:IclR family transcriptional regulator [Ornithinimicrobium murale]